jgi:glycine cleavage system H protein
MKVPVDLKYSSSDEWIKLEGDVATIGITDYAQDQLSDIVFVEITVEPGETVTKNSVGITLESVKAAADVNLPVSGKVLEINEALSQSPELVNSDPFGGAWMVKIQLSNPAEMDNLMDAAGYEKYCQERSH